jgi:hypothetical protein
MERKGWVRKMANARLKAYKVLLNAVDATASAVIDLKGDFDSLSLQIIGSAANSARTITFEASLDGTNYDDIMGSLVSATATKAVSTTSKDQTWTFPVTDITRFKVSLTAITGGTITVVASMTRAV